MTGLGQMLRATDGSTLLKFAFVGPAAFLLLVGGIDLLSVTRSQDRLQVIADGAAAAGAQVLDSTADTATVRAHAAAFVASEMRQWSGAPAYEAKYVIVDGTGHPGLRVVLLGHRPSFFANMLPPGGWHFIGDASAAPA